MKRLQKNAELLWDVGEALENMQIYLPVYKTILKKTGDKKQAIAALKFIKRMNESV